MDGTLASVYLSGSGPKKRASSKRDWVTEDALAAILLSIMLRSKEFCPREMSQGLIVYRFESNRIFHETILYVCLLFG